jgi:hypothetical protein
MIALFAALADIDHHHPPQTDRPTGRLALYPGRSGASATGAGAGLWSVLFVTFCYHQHPIIRRRIRAKAGERFASTEVVEIKTHEWSPMNDGV